MHMTVQLLLGLFITYVVGSITLIILYSRYWYLRGVQKGRAMKERSEQSRLVLDVIREQGEEHEVG